MSKASQLSLHLFIWAVFYLVMLAIVDSLLGTTGMGNFLNPVIVLKIAFMLLISFVVPFYMFFFIARSRLKSPTTPIINFLGFTSVLLLPFAYIAMDEQQITISSYLKTLVLVLFFAMLGYMFRGFMHSFNLKREKEILHRQLLQTELDFLKGQISPHFLFNTLNNIDALIAINPKEASRSLISMAEIMRYMIYDTHSQYVSLKNDLHYLQSLLSLYSLRFKKQGMVQFNLNAEPDKYSIPPMLLIPLAENAFKHHSIKHNSEGIKIDIQINNDMLEMSCSNSYDPVKKRTDSHGVGLTTLKRRLEILFPGTHTLRVHPAGNVFNITLIIPLTSVAVTRSNQNLRKAMIS